MRPWGAYVGTWLQQVAGAFPDTIVTKQVAPDEGWFATITSIAGGLVSITLLVLAAALVPAAWNSRKLHKRVNDLLSQFYGDMTPIVRHAQSIADNVDYITTSVRADIEQVHRTVTSATDRLGEALAQSERRVRELNALLRMIQEEAESTFVSTAATVRGVRAGAAAWHGDADQPDDADLPDLESEEDIDGYDSPPDGERIPGPRIRPRGRPGGAA
jgi:uncharacterized protein YoxC